MTLNKSKIAITLPMKIETTFQIDSILYKIEDKINKLNYEFYNKVILSKIKVSYYRVYFMKKYQILLKTKKIQFHQLFQTNFEIPNLRLKHGQTSNLERFNSQSSSNNTKKYKKNSSVSKYLFTPYKQFHIIYTGMTS